MKKKFDDFYGRKENYFSTKQSDGMQAMIEKYNVKPCKALDIGAGEGRNAIYLSKIGFDVVAVEPSVEGCKKIDAKARELNLNIDVQNKDFLSLKVKDKFNFILASTSLEHMEYEYLQEAIQKIKNSLNVGGYIYIVVFTEKDPGFKKDIQNASECAMFIKHYFKENELKNYFSDFEIIYYNEYLKEDLTHGKPHYHGKAKIFARKIKE